MSKEEQTTDPKEGIQRGKDELMEDPLVHEGGKDPFFSMEDEPKEKGGKTTGTKPLFLISTDSFSNCGLDMVFELSKTAGFDGIDLAIRKNFDARNVDYVKKLSTTHNIPVKVIQVSDNVNQKELNKALDLCEATGADTITINAPSYFNLKAYNFIVDNITTYKKDNKHIHFAIINPEDSNVFALPIPKYHFTNIVDIVKKYGCYIGFDVANFDAETLENEVMKKLPNLLPYIAVLYFSDKNRLGEWHILPGEWTLKLGAFLKKVKQNWFMRYFSSKININKSELADSEKLADLLGKAREYYKTHFEELKTDE